MKENEKDFQLFDDPVLRERSFENLIFFHWSVRKNSDHPDEFFLSTVIGMPFGKRRNRFKEKQ